MKWKTVKPVPKHGEIRTRRKIAWLPVEVQDHTVWLETYQITEQYVEYRSEHAIPSHWRELSKDLLYPYY
jgi:hypothetical protein